LLQKGTLEAQEIGLESRARKRVKLAGNGPGNGPRPNSEQQHHGYGHKLGCRGQKQYCTQCRKPPAKRLVLGEKSTNLQARKVVGKSKLAQKRRQSSYGCIICNIAICKEGNCFDLHGNSP
jgi:hypothetical protein